MCGRILPAMKKQEPQPYARTMPSAGKDWTALRLAGGVSFLTPIALYLVAFFMRRAGYSVPESRYDTPVMHWVMYILFAVGTVVFFFSDGMADFIQRRVFRTGHGAVNPARGYLIYTIGTGCLLDLISISAFVGFLICGNFIWLGLFVLLQCGLQIKYLPTQKRLERLLAREGQEGPAR